MSVPGRPAGNSVNARKPVGIGKWQRPEKDHVHETEHHGIRPDAQRERQCRDRGKAGVLQQLAEGEFEVVHGSWSVVRCSCSVGSLGAAASWIAVAERK